MHELLPAIAEIIELAGVAIICLGILIAIFLYARRCIAESANREAYESFRANLGRGILLGLELLVAADIIFTVTSPLTWESVGLLGLIVLIRTFLSFSLETEIEGVLPWRRRMMNEQDSQVR
ncbi:DUF1622 domain-containing protein [Sphingomicrobium arenosum]|uniref:DUF1622 domain-containing protein n=1 Tax=Sphingomicrobium arenosum TaxID=2233861 RepID=UPI00223F14C5|nr:DUF1622 domain-containing protein [Sphingomicrobium arenosum]